MTENHLERRINLGQDINNTWAVIASKNPDNDSLARSFGDVFPIVREQSQAARLFAQKYEGDTLTPMLLAIEWGFKAHEKGMNIEQAFTEFQKANL